jgi:hypothetical protein
MPSPQLTSLVVARRKSAAVFPFSPSPRLCFALLLRPSLLRKQIARVHWVDAAQQGMLVSVVPQTPTWELARVARVRTRSQNCLCRAPKMLSKKSQWHSARGSSFLIHSYYNAPHAESPIALLRCWAIALLRYCARTCKASCRPHNCVQCTSLTTEWIPPL